MSKQSKTTSEILSLCDGRNIGVNAWRWTESYQASEPWRAELKVQGDGVDVKGAAGGASFDEALGLAWGKIEPFLAVSAGRKLLAQPIEVTVVGTASGSDDILF